MNAINLSIELLEPVLVTSDEGEVNSAVSYDFIPGSAIRGAFISALLNHDSTTVLAPYLDGTVIFLNGYLEYARQRSIPLPISLRRDKNGDDGDNIAWDLAFGLAPAECAGQTPQWVRVGRGYASLQNVGYVSTVEVNRQIAIHTSRDRMAGRATQDNGAVYRYDSLAAGQIFQSVALCEDSRHFDILTTILPGYHRLGAAIRSGYGRVLIKILEQTEQSTGPRTDNWREAAFDRPQPGEPQTVMFLSDTIVREPMGSYSVSISALLRSLGLHEGSKASGFLEHTTVGGFNRTWGLPLPQALAVRRGSLVVLPAETFGDAEMDHLERSGIGERRGEGFGRLAFFSSPQYWELNRAVEVDTKLIRIVNLKEGTESFSLACNLSQRIMHRRNIMKSRQQALETDFVRGDIRTSQLARLREAIWRELQKPNSQNKEYISPDPRTILEFVSKLGKSADAQYSTVYVRSIPFKQWLESNANAATGLTAGPKIGGAQYQIDLPATNRRQLEYIDSVLARMMKQEPKS